MNRHARIIWTPFNAWLELVGRESRILALGMTLRLCAACLLPVCLMAGEAPPEKCEVDDQIELFRQWKSSVTEHDWFASSGDVRYLLVTKGDSYRFAYIPLDSVWGEPMKPGDKRAKRQGGYILSYSEKMRQRLDLDTGKMEVTRTIPKSRPGESTRFGMHTPPVLFPLGFLSWKDQNPWLPGRLQWGDVWDRSLIAKRVRDLIKNDPQPPLNDERTLIVEFKSIEVGDGGAISYVAKGSTDRLLMRRHAEFGGRYLVDEKATHHRDESLSEGRYGYIYAYQAVTAADGTVFPVLRQIVSRGPEPQRVICRLRRAEINGKIDQDDIEIDPTLAKTIYDLDTKMTIEPQ